MEWTFGQAALEGFLKGREQSQQRDEFRQKLMMQERQDSLMNMFRQRDDERMQSVANAQIANYNSEIKNRESGTNDSILGSYADGYVIKDPTTGLPKKIPYDINKPTEYETKVIKNNGVEETYQIPKGGQITSDMKPIATTPEYKPNELTPNEQYNIREKRKLAENKYKDILNSQWYSKAQLEVAGIDAPIKNNEWGGGWVVDGKFIPTKDQLEKRARAISGYSGKSLIKIEDKQPENKYVEGQIYIDANGNKAKWTNGKFEDIK